MVEGGHDDARREPAGPPAGTQGLAVECAGLRDRLGFLELIFQGDLLASYEWDLPRGEVVLDARVTDLLGWDPTDLGRSAAGFLALGHPEDRQRVADALSRYLEGRSPLYDVERRMRHASGAWTWLRDRCRVVARDAHGRPTRLRGALRDITARKTAEMALRESERRYRRITEAVTDYIYSVRLEAERPVETKHGPGCVAVTGYAAEDFAAESLLWHRMIVPEDRPAVEEQTRRLLAGEEVGPIEHRIVRRDGHVRWVRNTAVRYCDPTGRLVAYDGLIQDITERRQAEEALRESEERHRLITENMTDLVALIGPDMRYTYVSPSLTPQVGHRPEGLLGGSVADLIHPEDLPAVRERHMAAVARRDPTAALEFRLRHSAGHYLWFEAASRLFYDEGGALTHLLVVARNTAARKAAEQALAAERERLAVTLGSIGDGVIAADTEGLIRILNPVAESLTGWPEEQALGRPLESVFTAFEPGAQRGRCQVVETVIRRGEALLLQHALLVDRDEGHCLVALTAAPIRDASGQTMGAVLVFRDITEHERLERELLKAQKLESISLLAGGIAHDFNNILTGVLGNISAARQHAHVADKVRDRLAEAERATLRARDLTQQLLTFSKGGAPVRRPAHLAPLVREAVTFALRGSNVVANLDLPEDLRAAEVDPGQINQALGNIVINAAQAMPGGGTIRVEARNADLAPDNVFSCSPGPHVVIRVEDTGCGIAAEQLDRVFDPFFTTKAAGSGLGLTTTYSIIRRHDGAITVDSQPGRGTTFTLALPATDRPVDEPIEARVRPPARSARVLIMDDEAIVRDLATEVLTDAGYEVQSVRDGAEALARYREALASGSRFDAVIMDLTIAGGMGGRETLTRVRELDPDVRAIVSSGYSNDPIMAQHHEFGFRAVLLKPYTVHGLLSALAEAMADDTHTSSVGD